MSEQIEPITFNLLIEYFEQLYNLNSYDFTPEKAQEIVVFLLEKREELNNAYERAAFVCEDRAYKIGGLIDGPRTAEAIRALKTK